MIIILSTFRQCCLLQHSSGYKTAQVFVTQFCILKKSILLTSQHINVCRISRLREAIIWRFYTEEMTHKLGTVTNFEVLFPVVSLFFKFFAFSYLISDAAPGNIVLITLLTARYILYRIIPL